MTLVDTSVWIDHFRQSDSRLQTLLDERGVVMHPSVIGELCCGNLPRRGETILYLQSLPQAGSIAETDETLFVIESRKVWGKGLGWTDAQLVASALMSSCKLWTHDRQLREVAFALGIGY